jgi:HEPN domain-containing protein
MARRFMAQAEHDLAAAEYLLSSPHAFAVARQAFEAAEKALKAAHYHVRAEEPGYHHDVDALIEQLTERMGPAPSEIEEAATVLRPVFEKVRYPSGRVSDPIPADTIGVDAARAVVQASKEVLEWARTLMALPPGRPRRTRHS